MTTELHGDLNGRGLRVAIVAARFNEFITARLLAGAKEGLLRHGVSQNEVAVAHVPGSFELPLTARRLASTGRFDAVIAIGAVIKGETDHYDYVAGEVSKGIASVSAETGIPVIFAVLTTHTVEQAINRSGGKNGNSGYTAAIAAIEMANLLRSIEALS